MNRKFPGHAMVLKRCSAQVVVHTSTNHAICLPTFNSEHFSLNLAICRQNESIRNYCKIAKALPSWLPRRWRRWRSQRVDAVALPFTPKPTGKFHSIFLRVSCVLFAVFFLHLFELHSSRTVALIQYLGMPLGPSSKTWPKWMLLDFDLTSVLFIPYELSGSS